jgi:dipeptide/tripeptide permease
VLFNSSEFSLLGLALIAVGTGGIKPCVSAFGGDQFKLPEQERQLQTFFSVFYFAINAGSLISTALTPILRYTSNNMISYTQTGITLVLLNLRLLGNL